MWTWTKISETEVYEAQLNSNLILTQIKQYMVLQNMGPCSFSGYKMKKQTAIFLDATITRNH